MTALVAIDWIDFCPLLRLNPFLQNKPLDLAPRRFGNAVRKLDPARKFISRNAVSDKLLEIF
jgi:hypothetical protein